MPEPITAVVIKGMEPAGTTAIPDGTVLSTADHHPNVLIKTLSVLQTLAIRFGFMFFTSLAGSVTGGAVSGQTVIVWHDFSELLYKAAILAAITGAIDLIKNLATIFSRLEQSHPLMTGNV